MKCSSTKSEDQYTFIDFNRFEQLMETARAEIEILEKNSRKNPCFFSAANKCFASYEIARKARKKMMEEKDVKRKEDMEMTLSFCLAFSALNIEKANKCFK